MHPLLLNILTFGEQPDDSMTRSRVIRLFNGSLWFVTLLAALYIPVFYFLDQLFLSALLCGFLLVYILAIVLQALGLFTSSRITFLICFNTGLSVYHTLTNEQFSFIILYLVFITSSNLFILRGEWFLKSMYVLVPTVLLVFHETTDIQYFLPLDIPDKTELWLRTLLVPTFVAFFIAIEYYISYTFLRRERELEKAFDQVANADRTKSEFLSLMSHELRTPLNAISHILTEITDQQKAMTLEELTTLKSSARQLEYLTNNFVDFKALTQDEAPLEEHTSVDLKQFLEDACNNLKPLADEKDNEIVVEILGVLPACIQLHKATLELALRHILENAIRFSDHSTIQIVCEMVHMQDRPNAFKIRIIDQGIGIDPTQLNRIFEPFYQVETVTQRSNGGTGLGLAISKQCMKMIGGRIEVKSDLGKGSTFELCFTAKACDTPSNLLIETTELPLKNHNVLVVDDNLVNQKISRKFLEKLGANVQVMDDGQQAVNLSNVETFSLIFMDLHMPKMNGFDAAGLIRCSGKNTQTPIIAYSADNQESVQQKAKQAGMTGFVSKPLHFDSLRNVVINQLSEQRNKTAL